MPSCGLTRLKQLLGWDLFGHQSTDHMRDPGFPVRVTLETFPTSGNAGRLQCNNWCSVQKYEWAAFDNKMFLYNKPSRYFSDGFTEG